MAAIEKIVIKIKTLTSSMFRFCMSCTRFPSSLSAISSMLRKGMSPKVFTTPAYNMIYILLLNYDKILTFSTVYNLLCCCSLHQDIFYADF